MSEAGRREAVRRALVDEARERLRKHLGEQAAALAGDDPALDVVVRITEQLRRAGG